MNVRASKETQTITEGASEPLFSILLAQSIQVHWFEAQAVIERPMKYSKSRPFMKKSVDT